MNESSPAGGSAQPAFTRAAFQAAQEHAQRVEQSGGTPMAIIAVVLGFGQLYLLRWGKDHVPREQLVPLATVVFFVYLGIVGTLLVRMVRARNAAAPRCPQCGVTLRDLSQRVALATGKCDRCGGVVIAGE